MPWRPCSSRPRPSASTQTDLPIHTANSTPHPRAWRLRIGSCPINLRSSILYPCSPRLPQNKRTPAATAKVFHRPEDRMVLEADKEIADTQAALEKAKGLTATEQWTDINPVHQNLEIEMTKEQTELAGMKARRTSLARQVDGYRSRLMALGGATTVHDDLMRQEKQAEDNYLLYAKKAEEARIEESLDRQKIGNVVIAEHPVEPRLPSKPNVAVNLTLGALLASFLSIAFVFGSEHLRRPGQGVELVGQPRLESGFAGSLAARDELEMLTGLRVLATVYTGGRSAS